MPVLIVVMVPEELKLTASLPRFFAGGGAVGEIFPGRDVGEDRCCGHDVGVAIIGSVCVLVEQEAGFPR